MNLVAALVPVVAFLAILVLIDSFKLVGLKAVGAAIATGAVASVLSFAGDSLLLSDLGLPLDIVERYVAPIVEESAKCAFVLLLARRTRVGFLVDAAIIGFAIGTGFGLVENVYYLHGLGDQPVALWMVRGFGTAMLHGATTAIFAILVRRAPGRGFGAAFAGWAMAVVIHSAYNHHLVPPLLATLLLLVLLPVLMEFVFARSESATRDWVGAGLDLDLELLDLLLSADFATTRVGAYLEELKNRLPGPVVADMFCLLRTEIELGIRAKGMLMARASGLEAPVDETLLAQLDEAAYLRRSIGRTGLLALRPLGITSDRDEWHRYLLEQAAAGRRPRSRVGLGLREELREHETG